MKTIMVSIGNSDNKLTQKEWADFVELIDDAIRTGSISVHFMGGAANWMPWQNVAWLFDCDEAEIDSFKSYFQSTKERYNQDSIAWLEGDTLFL